MEPTSNPPAEPESVPPHIVESPHAPGQVIGPTESILAPPTASDLTMPADTGERPTAVVMPGQADNSVINGQIIGQHDAHTSALKRLSKRPMLIMALVPLLLLGGSAAAYFGYVVPNKPENILAKALSNSLSEHQVTTKGTLSATSGGISTKIEYTAATNEDSHATSLNLNATISGVNIPLEVISAKGNVYFKVGDLSSLEGIANQFIGDSSPGIKTLEDKINKSVTNQWISVDSTLIKEAKLDCLANFPASFSQTDIKSLKAAYAKAQFATISSHSADTVNGVKATKYEVKIDDNVLSKFNLNGTSYFKNINDCLKKADPSSTLDLSSSKDGDTTPITIWVDSAKRIVKYSSLSTAKDKAKGIEGDITGTITYGNVNISAPANTKPVLNLLNDFGLSDLLNGFDSSGTAANTERKTDLNALATQAEVAYADNGFYPSLAQFNDPAWRAANMKGSDPAALKDPASSSAILAAAPAAHVYSYQALPVGCNNVKIQCTNYTLTATLDDGSTYTKSALNAPAAPPTVLN